MNTPVQTAAVQNSDFVPVTLSSKTAGILRLKNAARRILQEALAYDQVSFDSIEELEAALVDCEVENARRCKGNLDPK